MRILCHMNTFIAAKARSGLLQLLFFSKNWQLCFSFHSKSFFFLGHYLSPSIAGSTARRLQILRDGFDSRLELIAFDIYTGWLLI